MSMLMRTRDAERTRAALLRAAQVAFSTRGFAVAGVREISAAAGVSPGLVVRYFGSKEGLFEAALADLLDVSLLTHEPRQQFGRALVVTLTRESADKTNPLQMMLLATADPAAREITRKLLTQQVIEPLSAWFDLPNAQERAARLVLLASGMFLYRLLYPLAPFSGTLAPASREWLERVFQSVIDDPE